MHDSRRQRDKWVQADLETNMAPALMAGGVNLITPQRFGQKFKIQDAVKYTIQTLMARRTLLCLAQVEAVAPDSRGNPVRQTSSALSRAPCTVLLLRQF